ncbi:DUF1761 domain-containing protein [Jiella marina]|uniref:DUF1761 domain-containing protein n=1 Tax=Jiella sp. LLJ827 TaxID=2917712 RepID=UPI002100E69C|nr:DUF1761 domain-containing protein [Jiella sp. LLJ827]
MSIATLDYFAILTATVISMIVGTIWYTALGRFWLRAVGLAEDQARQRASDIVIAFLAEFIMATIFAVLLAHFDGYTLLDAITAALFLWLGFVMTTVIVNARFQGRSWDLPLIDGGHWLLVLLAQGAVFGAFR